jgi:ABC-type sugar transport system substrate-binding protein
MSVSSRRSIPAGLIVLVLLVVGAMYWRTGSVPGTAGGTRLTPSGTTERLAEDASIEPVKPARRYKVGVLFPFLASPFWVNEAYGVLDQAQKAGIDVIWLSADGYDNIGKQNSQLEDLVAQRVDAILLGATSSTGTAPAVERAWEAGVPVFAHVTSSQSPRVIAAVVDDDLSIGRKQGEFMGQALSGRGVVAMLNGPAAAEWSSLRVKGFKEVMAAKYPGIRIAVERNGIPDRADARRLAEDVLASNPEVRGMFTVADGMAMGAVDAARAVNRIDHLVVTTASFSREAIPYMRKGDIDLNVDENPVIMGRVAINTLIRALNGEQVASTVYVPNPAITGKDLDSIDLINRWAPESWRIGR